MGGNIISGAFGETPDPEPEMCLQCDCGSISFSVLSTGDIECLKCKGRMDDGITEVDFSKAKAGVASEVLAVSSDVSDLALSRTLARASEDITAGVIVLQKDGDRHVWSIYDGSSEDRKWFRDALKAAAEMITWPDKPDSE